MKPPGDVVDLTPVGRAAAVALPAASADTNAAAAAAPDYQALYLAALRAAQARDERLAVLAHDLRNPLNALMVSAEVLKRAPPDSAEARGAAAIIARQVVRLADLVGLHLAPPRAPIAVSMSTPPTAPVVTSWAAGTEASPRLQVGIIERHADGLSHLRAMLEAAGHRVCTAASGPDGLAMLLHDAPDVALVEVDLPDFGGHQLARRSLAAGYRGRLVALSGSGLDEDRARSLAAGFELHLPMPIDADHLARALLR